MAAIAMLLASASGLATSTAYALEHVTLKNGFAFDCVRRETQGDKIRLFLAPHPGLQASDSYLDVAADAVASVETLPDPPPAPPSLSVEAKVLGVAATLEPTVAELGVILAQSGAAHNVDTDLLASVIKAESGGHTRAVSRTGARGLMQLMPSTATELGVKDAFVPGQNIEGGTRYLDALLTRYHDNIALALAAYNAGPGAVDKYHGVPPFPETRMYVARVIREFNRRKTVLMARGN